MVIVRIQGQDVKIDLLIISNMQAGYLFRVEKYYIFRYDMQSEVNSILIQIYIIYRILIHSHSLYMNTLKLLKVFYYY